MYASHIIFPLKIKHMQRCYNILIHLILIFMHISLQEETIFIPIGAIQLEAA